MKTTGWVLRDYRLKLKLGWGAPERRRPQEVRFDVELRFRKVPRACATDRLGDTVCYDEVARRLSRLGAREYRLIEHLTEEAYAAVRELAPAARAQLRIEVTKLKAPVAGLRGDVRFFISDWS